MGTQRISAIGDIRKHANGLSMVGERWAPHPPVSLSDQSGGRGRTGIGEGLERLAPEG